MFISFVAFDFFYMIYEQRMLKESERMIILKMTGLFSINGFVTAKTITAKDALDFYSLFKGAYLPALVTYHLIVM